MYQINELSSILLKQSFLHLILVDNGDILNKQTLDHNLGQLHRVIERWCREDYNVEADGLDLVIREENLLPPFRRKDLYVLRSKVKYESC